MDYLDYRSRLGIGFNDKDKQSIFINRIQVFLISNRAAIFSEDQERQFCYAIGVPCLLKNKPILEIKFDDTEPAGYQRTWLYLQRKAECFPDFLASLVVFANGHCGSKKQKVKVQNAIRLALKDSHIEYDLYEDEDGSFIFPKGAEELDNALVSQPLAWLSEYPQAHTAFTKALKEYSDALPENASDIADKFRKSLETFMQEFFGTDKSLENCKAIYGGYLKEQGVPKEISGNLETLLNSYTTFMNNYAKHHDKTSINVLEYIMYQTGNIIRLLITLKQRENENAD